MSIIKDGAIIINSPADLEAEMCRYNCHTKEELEEALQRDYDAALIINYKYED